MATKDDLIAAGSSPRWRGARHARRVPLDPLGLIPAVAGSTLGTARRGARSRAHPRGGGEHPTGSVAVEDHPGSSPRWRGAPAGVGSNVAEAGLIPAVAGSTLARPNPGGTGRAHPRGGGEHVLRRERCCGRGGSSPRWRGAPLYNLERPDLAAGSSPRWRGARPSRQSSARSSGGSSPRWRGALRVGGVCRTTEQGSSPRWRGAPILGAACHRLPTGLIPAVAGSTCSPPRSPGSYAGSSPRWRGARSRAVRPRPAPGAHPRGGGEHTAAAPDSPRRPGAHPRGGGEHKPSCGPITGTAGLIPAVAGSTWCRPATREDCWAHPRGGGEHRERLRRLSTVLRAHPRGGGEHLLHAGELAPHLGSSPRWRGALREDMDGIG